MELQPSVPGAMVSHANCQANDRNHKKELPGKELQDDLKAARTSVTQKTIRNELRHNNLSSYMTHKSHVLKKVAQRCTSRSIYTILNNILWSDETKKESLAVIQHHVW